MMYLLHKVFAILVIANSLRRAYAKTGFAIIDQRLNNFKEYLSSRLMALEVLGIEPTILAPGFSESKK